MKHVDEWLEVPSVKGFTPEEDGEVYAKFVLNYFRFPAWMIESFKPWMGQYKLFCTYQGQRYRCTGASQLGDIWLNDDPTKGNGYTKRVDVEECSKWSDKFEEE